MSHHWVCSSSSSYCCSSGILSLSSAWPILELSAAWFCRADLLISTHSSFQYFWICEINVVTSHHHLVLVSLLAAAVEPGCGHLYYEKKVCCIEFSCIKYQGFGYGSCSSVPLGAVHEYKCVLVGDVGIVLVDPSCHKWNESPTGPPYYALTGVQAAEYHHRILLLNWLLIFSLSSTPAMFELIYFEWWQGGWQGSLI